MMKGICLGEKANQKSSREPAIGRAGASVFASFKPENEKPSAQDLMRAACFSHHFAEIDILPRPVVQPKLVVGPPGDKYEQEADRVADEVMRMSEMKSLSSDDHQTQLVCEKCEEGDERFQATEMSAKNVDVASGLESRINALRCGGQPLPQTERAFFESRFGYDFDKVRVHTDLQAAELAKMINARAFTIGKDIVFGKGESAPKTNRGRRLLAHELSHVVQQSKGYLPRRRSQCQRVDFRPLINTTRNISEELTLRMHEGDNIPFPITLNTSMLIQRALDNEESVQGEIEHMTGTTTVSYQIVRELLTRLHLRRRILGLQRRRIEFQRRHWRCFPNGDCGFVGITQPEYTHRDSLLLDQIIRLRREVHRAHREPVILSNVRIAIADPFGQDLDINDALRIIETAYVFEDGEHFGVETRWERTNVFPRLPEERPHQGLYYLFIAVTRPADIQANTIASAETARNAVISNRAIYIPDSDHADVVEISTIEGFIALFGRINTACQRDSLRVRQIEVFSHGGLDGPMFGNNRQQFGLAGAPSLSTLPRLPYTGDAIVFFRGCRIGSGGFLEAFARQQGVATYGFEGTTSFSTRPGSFYAWSTGTPAYQLEFPGSETVSQITGRHPMAVPPIGYAPRREIIQRKVQTKDADNIDLSLSTCIEPMISFYPPSYRQDSDHVAQKITWIQKMCPKCHAEIELFQAKPTCGLITRLVQRHEAKLESSDHTPPQRECRECDRRSKEEDELRQRLRLAGTLPFVWSTTVEPHLDLAIQKSRGNGQPLPEGVRLSMERAFGMDFKDVRLHTDTQADSLNRSLQARAFTTRQDIFLREGEYRPGSSEGQRLLAHELTHVAQQTKSLQKCLVQREASQVVPATNQQRRDFVQEAIRFLDQAAEFYLLQRQTNQERLDASFDGITSTYTSNERIINTDLNSDADLTNSLKQAYQNALRNLFLNAAALLNIPLRDLYLRHVDRIPLWVSWPDFSRTQAQVNISGTVGLDGNNAPDDVRAIQQRLVELGYLTLQDFVSERPAQPVQGGQALAQVDIATIPRTLVAIGRFSRAAFGRPSLTISPDQASLTFLNAPLPQSVGVIDVGADVGRGGANNPADVLAVQQRLHAINLLSQEHFQTEQVAPNAPNVNENAIQNTINAIGRLHREMTGSNLWIIRPNSREEEILNNPPRFTTQAIEFSHSVGRGQNNAPSDVRLLQERLLDLAHLTQVHFEAEVIDPANAANPARIPDNQIPQTIAALSSFQVSRRLNGSGQLEPGSETHRMLIRPSLPTSIEGHLNARVGVGGAGNANINQPADVRMVQERLHELGFLSDADFISERADPAAGGSIASGQLTRTIDAIRRFQSLVVGRTDGNIDPGGMSLRILCDPTYGTLTTFNPEANNPQAGIAFSGAGGPQLNRIIQAIEQAEAGNRTGEAPAGLINAAGVPASFGRGQTIGGTALGILINPRNAQLRDQYGLDLSTLNTINDRAVRTGARYDEIYRLVGAGGVTEANLQALYTAYIAANGALFHAETGLYDQDIINMFRIAQIKRRIIAHPIPRNPVNTEVINPADVNPAVNALLQNVDFSASYSALRFNRSSLQAYVRMTRSMGENRAGFITKAIFSYPDSQRIRNAMTDASGAAIGRILIQQNFNSSNAVVPAGQADRDRVVAAITARIHNGGGTAQNHYANLTSTLADPYVRRVLGFW